MLDGVLGNADDFVGSAGVPLHSENGHYVWNAEFRMRPRVGRRRAPTVFGAAYAFRLLRDGRAGPSFTDPLTGLLVVASGASLEDQALKPLLDVNEMGSVDGVIADVPARIAGVRPLALADQVPLALKAWIGSRTPNSFKKLSAQRHSTGQDCVGDCELWENSKS